MSRISRVKTPRKAAPKSFDYIPYESRRKITRDQFGALVGRVLGGNYQNEKLPWKSRRAIRDVFEETGHLKTLESKQHFDERKAREMLKDFRKVLKERRKEAGYGIRETGKYFGKKEAQVYRKFVEEEFNKANKPSAADEQQTALEIRVRRARHREIERQQLGLTPSLVRIGANDRPDPRIGRREGSQARIEAERNKRDAGTQKQGEQHAGGQSLPGTPLHASSLHVPPQPAIVSSLEQPIVRSVPRSPSSEGTQQKSPNEDVKTLPQSEEVSTSQKPPVERTNIDDSLPLAA